jgi:hypothetical protein
MAGGAFLWRIFHPFHSFASFVLRVVTFPVDVLFSVLNVVWSEEASQPVIVSNFKNSGFAKLYRDYVRPICVDYFMLPVPPLYESVIVWKNTLYGEIESLEEESSETPNSDERAFWVIKADKSCGYCSGAERGPHDLIKEESVEKVDDSKRGNSYKLISPILTELVVLYMLYYVFVEIHIRQDYLTHVSMCPVVDYGKSWVGWLDTKLLYYLREPLTTYCAFEDSFYKLFTDAWVRDVVTDTDDTMLLVYTRLKAIAFQAVLMVVIIPALSWVLSFLNLVFFVIENWILHGIVERFLPNLKPGFKAMGQFVRYLKKFSPFDKNEAPPMTAWRYRDSRDSVEMVLYARDRVVRFWQHFHDSIEADLTKLVADLVKTVTVYRFICIWTHNLFDDYCVGSFVRMVIGLFGSYPSRLLTKHQRWFTKGSSGMVDDWMIMNQFKWWALEAGEGVLSVGETSVVGDMQMLLVQLFLGCLVVVGLIIWRLVVERKAFDRKYDAMAVQAQKWPLNDKFKVVPQN